MLVRDSISAIIIDDENHSIQTLKYELSRHCPQVLVVHTSTTIREGKLAIEQHRPDLLFLDIEMPGGNGFQLLNDMETIDFEVIFVTAYDQYAIQAFRFAAIDYLLKPIIAKNLTDAVDRVSIKKKGTLTKRQLVNLLHNLKSDMHHSPRIAIPNGSTTEFIDVEQILHCEANSNYTYVFTKNEGRFLMSKTLRELEELFQPPNKTDAVTYKEV